MWAESAAAGFLPLLPAGYLLPELDRERLREVLADPAAQILLAEDDGGEVVGYSAHGSNRDADVEPDVGEVRTFFVLPSAWRRGVGSRLMEEALAWLAERGYREATVWSFADNARANAFYERHGFVRDGTERREEAWAGILEVRYRRSKLASNA